MAEDGTELVLVARRRARLEEVAGEARARGAEAEVLVADLTDHEQLAAVERRLADGERPVDLLVNNAGFGTHGPFASLPVEREEDEITLNVLAPVRLTRAVLPGMLARGGGGIVNVSSIAGLQPLPDWATYAATKAYLTSFSEAVHEEVHAQGVTVLALLPGFTRTEFQERSGSHTLRIPGPFWMSADDVARAGLRALARGRALHVPGAGYRAVATLSRLTPWSLTRRVVHLAGRRL